LTEGKNLNCRVLINSYERPAHFNISGANNLGLHFATGKYVMFANSDIIYPSSYGRRFAEMMDQQNVGYAVGSRYNLSQDETQSLRPASTYTLNNNFDFIDTEWTFASWRKVGMPPIWPGCGPWVIRRDVAVAVGGFDPAVLVSEDDDITSRVVHYMTRHGGQSSNVSFLEMLGYHLYHPTSELFDWHREAHLLIDARRDRLKRNPGSEEDIVPNRLDDLESLVTAVRNTPKPPPFKRYREDTLRKVGKRVVAATKVLLGRR
jgi:hypothetical protein